MKAKFLALAALVLGLASCQTDPEVVGPVAGNGEVDFQLCVAAPELTRAGENGAADEQNAWDSAFGAIDYLQATDAADDYRIDWTEVDLRYTLEVYDVAGDYADATPVKDRQVIIVDKYEPVAFDLRLVPNRDYHFVVFADFVMTKDATDNPAIEAQRNIGARHIIGNTLGDITIKNDAINDEIADAYFATKDINISNSAAQDIVLRRPYGKLRVVATDLAELNINVDPRSVEVVYTAQHPTQFNAVTGDIVSEVAEGKATYASVYNDIFKGIKEGGLQNHFYTAGYDNYELYGTKNANNVERHTHMTLFTDYIFGEQQENAQTPYHFTLNVYDKAGVLIKSTDFNTDIPVERNKLTTVVGNVLTTATEIEVRIDDNFAGEYVQSSWDGKATKPKKDGNGNWIIAEESELAWLAAAVNGTLDTRATVTPQTFKGETFKLSKDIDLNNDRWIPIGATGKFEGTFDGQGHEITNLFVSESDKTPAGLFANAYMVKNVKVIGAEIYGHYKGAVIVGDGLCSRIEDCHVENATVVITPLNNDDGNHAGGIVGYLSAENEAYVKNCSVKNAEIRGYRDVAAIAGTANQAAVVSGNKVENVTVIADQTVAYKEVKAANVDAIAGRVHAKATVENNTVGEDVVIIRKVDSTKEFEYALAERRNDDVIYVGKGEVVLPTSLAVSGINKLIVEGLDTAAAVQFSSVAGGGDGGLNCYADGTELIFKNIKVVSPNTGSAYTGGFGRAKSVLFDNCYYEGQYRSLSYVKFNKCTIDPKASYIYTDYSNADFVECTFNCSEGKGIQVYNDGNTSDTIINVTDCTFIAAKQGQTWDGKPVTAIDINSNGEKFTVNINNSTATDFPEGLYSGESLFNIKGGAEHVTIKIDGNTWVGKGIITDDEGNLVVNSILSLETALKSAGAAGAGDTTIVFEENSTLDMNGVEWKPINVDGYHGADIVTIEGNGAVITGLEAPLFAGGFAGGSGIVIKDLTIKDSNIVSANTLGSGAFIESVDSMAKIELINCHLIDSSVTGGAGSRTGGLIGWTAGYNNVNDGPVKTYVTIDGCSVIGCTITCDGSVGGINGHAGNNAWTFTTIKNCTVQGNTLASTDDGEWRVGVVVGTANVGEVTISNITESDNTLTQIGKTAPVGFLRNLYGRAVLGATGKLTIDGYTYKNGLFEDANGYKVIADGLLKKDNEYNVINANGLATLNTMMQNKTAGKNVIVNIMADIDFAGKTWTPVDSHADSAFTFSTLNGNNHTISNLTINGQAMFTRFAGSGNVTIKDVTFDHANVNSNGALNTSILTVQAYQNVLLDNVDVKNSAITGGYKVAPLMGTVYNEAQSTVTATLKNCDVENTIVTATLFDFCTTGMVAFVYAQDNDTIAFENCTVTNVKLMAPNDSYKAHAAIYTTGSESLYNEATGVTVTNVTFEAL